jgi:adenine-specific DNA-methyltransferase
MRSSTLPSVILESRTFNRQRADGHPNPFDQRDMVVTNSYQFAAAKAADISRLSWDLAVIDEAHRLRNVYGPSTKTARAIAKAR